MGFIKRMWEANKRFNAEFEQEKAKRDAARPDSFAGISLAGPWVVYGDDRRLLAGVSAVVDVSGNINRRITATRLVAGGIVGGLVFQKRQDDRELHLLIDGPDFQWVVPVDPAASDQARQFAARVNTAGRSRPS